ncbi:MAG: glycosyltransferase family 4 protein [Deltaproteobacteria bacterium]|nr:glycosyltransferase family 4 protein [Deltaproteobacteria bacterium]
MRVAIAVRRLSARGGMEGNVLALARRLVARGHAVTVVCQRADECLLDAEVVRIPVLGALGETAKLLSFARGAARALAGLGADVTFTSGHVAGPRVVRLESGLAAAYHDVLRAGGQGGGLTEWAARRVEARKLACAERILVLSEAAGRDVLARFGGPPERVVVAPNGVDLDRHPRATEAARAEARRALGVEGPTVAFVGSGFWRKGLDRALDALAHPDAPRATLLVAGTDRSQPRYEARARQLGLTVRWLGYQADVRPVLAAADALVLPARFEPFGLVALEAWAAGRPAVLMAAVGAAEVSPHPALVVPEPAEPGALARALAAAVTLHDAERCRAAAEAHPLAASLDRVVAVMEEVAR